MPPDAPLAPEIFRLAVEASPSGMVLVDGGGAIVMVNGEIERLFGYGRDELRGQPVEILLPDKLRGRHVRQRAGFVKHPEVRHLGTGREFLGRHKDGSEIPIEVGLNPLRMGDDFMMLCAIVDISERKRFERMQDEFVSTVSHELRTPMTSISASLGLMSGGAAGASSPSAAHLIEIAYGNCRRLVRLVNDILDIKKLESGQMDFRFKACDARVLAAQAIEANHEFAEGYGVRVRLGAAAEPSNVRAIPTALSKLSPTCFPTRSNSRRPAARLSSRSRRAATTCVFRYATTAPVFRTTLSRGYSGSSRKPTPSTNSKKAVPVSGLASCGRS